MPIPTLDLPRLAAPPAEAAPAALGPRRHPRLLLLGLSGLLVGAVLLGSGVGAAGIPLPAMLGIVLHKLGLSAGPPFEPQQEAILWAIRLPRVCLGVLVGGGLGLAGAALQGLFHNPLADPGLVGVSAGASLAAVATILLGGLLLKGPAGPVAAWLGPYLLPAAAFVGACATTLAVYRLARTAGRVEVSTMLLVGVAVNALAGALTGLLTYTATDAQLRSITFWGLGSLGGASWPVVLGIVPFVAGPFLLLPRMGKSLNLLALGEAQAAHLGLPVARLKRQLVVLATLAVGASVAVAGGIGFLGLVLPHLVRLAAGPDNRIVLPGSALGGAAVLVLADTLARTAAAPAEVPIGILTALLGAPVFLWILLREKRRLA